MSELLPSILILANLAIIIGGIFATRIVVKSSLAKSETEIKERIVNDLSKENEALRNRLQRIETENKQQARTLQSIITALKKLYNLDLNIDDDAITFRSSNGNVSRVPTDVP